MFAILLILFFLFMGSFTLKNLLIGVPVCGLLTVFCRRYVTGEPEPQSPKKLGKKLRYYVFLLKEILMSNIAVVKKIWSRTPVRPVLVRFHSGLATEGGNVLVANSITLTPGTFTCELEGDGFTVHALDRDFTDGIENCAFIGKVRELEAMK